MGYEYKETVTKAGTIEVITGNYLIDDMKIPSPTSIDCEYHIRTRARNDADDITHIKTIRLKRAVTWHYKKVSNETFKKIFDYIIKDNLMTKGNMTFNVQTQFIGEIEPIVMKMYAGSPITAQSVHGSKDRLLVTFDVHFIEPEGVELKQLEQ